METQSPTPASSEPYTTGKPCNCVRVDSPPNAYTVHKGICCHCRGTVKAEPYYGHRFPETDGDVTLMNRVSPYPPEFVETYFKSEYCLITNAVYPMRVYQPCTDLLPRTMAWLAAGVPTDFMDRVADNLGRWEVFE